ncbi:MAG: cystathionine gamma-synthase [Armatimonadetes bacterium]|nr:cystathionine gamma-synthase [Armatimonadota bacterium]
MRKFSFETRSIHDGQSPDQITGAVNVPIYQTSTYAQKELGKTYQGYEYSRSENPTRKALEECIASLEGAKYALAFSSGMAAIANILYLLSSSDHVIVSDDVYGGTYRLFSKIFTKFKLEFDFIDISSLESIKAALKRNTKMIWVESPTNPMLKLVDLELISKLAKEFNLISVVDNTFMSPYFQNPLEWGIDIAVHSTTKYLGGHSDIIGGALAAASNSIYEILKFHQKSIGAIPSPFDCFLVLRGIKTLALRMKEHQKNALKIAEFLEKHPEVSRVYYPGLSTHPQYILACRQMKGFGGMISFELREGISAVKNLFKNIKIFTLAESLGGVESLICHPASMTHASLPEDRRLSLGITDGLVRISVGIENIEDLLWDLEQALEKNRIIQKLG